MGRRPYNLEGLIVGDLMVLEEDEPKDDSGKRWWIAKCACGRVKSFRSDVLLLGKVKSCGCHKQKSKNDLTF